MKTLSKMFAAAVLILTAGLTTGCSSVSPNTGYEAVLTEKPILFGHGGVDPESVKAGQSWVALTTDASYVSMQPIQADLVLNDLMTSDGVPLSFDAVIRVQVTDSVDLIKRFGEGWYANNVEAQFRSLIRQAVRKRGMNETAISSTAIDAIDAEVDAGMHAYLASIKMPVNIIMVTVGKANPPDAIKSQRIETASQQQRVITEGQTKLAEDARKNAEQSRAEADNAYRLAMGLSPDQFIKLSWINAQRDICMHGGTNCTFISNGGGVTPIVDAREK